MLIPIILCGGVGSRLWPVSRDLHPKPFIKLSDGQSLLQKALLRAKEVTTDGEVMLVTNRELFFKTQDELEEIAANDMRPTYLLEPVGRNTAAAVTTATLQVARTYGNDAVLLVLPADHLIADQIGFERAVQEAMQHALSGKLVTFGIKPNFPETGYGYIEASGNEVLHFVEKPSLSKATEYVQSGRFLWNAGMFCFQVKAMMEALKELCPDILAAAEECLEKSRVVEGEGRKQVELQAQLFAKVPENSIDYAVMEKWKSVAVVPCDIGWSDVGSWDAISSLSPPDEEGNRIEGEVLLHDAKDCYVRSSQRIIGAVGVKNLLIVDTPDALLVADKSRAQDVKHLYAKLKERGHDAHRLHLTVHRPWGSYTILEENPRYKIKRIVVKPGHSLSLQMHHHRSEHWIVVSGIAKVTNGETDLLVRTNESTYIQAGHKHRLENPGILDLTMIEVQSGEYLGEDDIVRFEDYYGRK